MKIISCIAIIVQIVILLVYNWRFLFEIGNRTGENLSAYTQISIFYSAAMLCWVLFRKKKGDRIPRITILTIVLGILIALNIYIFDALNISVEYMEYFRRGRPEQPFGLPFF